MSDRKEKTSDEIEMNELNRQRKSVDAENLFTISHNLQEEDEEFKTLRKKYYQVSKEIRLEALDEEKKELQNDAKSPDPKYYEGSKMERIKLLDEAKRQLEDLGQILKTKK